MLPGLVRLRQYDRSWLRGDVLAGVTVVAYLVPQVMAYAELAGLPAVAGLWAAMVSLVVYAFAGSSPQLSVGPESTTALLTATAIAPFAAGDPSRYAALAAALAVIVGLLCLAARLARLGFLAELLSKPVLVGYLTGVAIIMIVGQLGRLSGAPVGGESVIERVSSFGRQLDAADAQTVGLAVGVLTFLFVLHHVAPRLPVPLLGVLLAAAVASLPGWGADSIARVGNVPQGLPSLQLPDVDLADLRALLLPALGVAIVGYTDNVLTGRAFAARSGRELDANQELFALGSANVVTGLFQGFPVSSSGSRTVIAATMGARTQLYSLVAVGSVLATLLFLRPVLGRFPEAALGALVVYAAVRLIDVAELRRIARFRSSELVLALATTVGVLVFDILYGVLLAVGLSLLDVLRRVARPHDGVLGYVPGVAGMHDIDDYPDARLVPGLIVYRYDSPLFFANANDFKRRALESLTVADGPVEWFVLNAEANVDIDITSVEALDDLRAELERRGIVFAMARVKQDLRDDLVAAGFLHNLRSDRMFMTLPTAVRAYLHWYQQEHGHLPPGVTPPAPAPTPYD